MGDVVSMDDPRSIAETESSRESRSFDLRDSGWRADVSYRDWKLWELQRRLSHPETPRVHPGLGAFAHEEFMGALEADLRASRRAARSLQRARRGLS